MNETIKLGNIPPHKPVGKTRALVLVICFFVACNFTLIQCTNRRIESVAVIFDGISRNRFLKSSRFWDDQFFAMLNPNFQPDEQVWHTGLENGAAKVNGDDVSAFKEPHSGSVVGEKPEEFVSRTKYTVSKGYDPHDFGNQENSTSFLGVVTHIIVISFGPTLLSIPAAFVNVGYVTGFGGTILTVFLYAYCMRMIVSCEYELCQRGKVPNMSYIGM